MNDDLERFGKEFIESVRDSSIASSENLLTGRCKAPSLETIQNKLANFSDEDKQTIKELIYRTIDETLHYMLWHMEQSDEFDIRAENSEVGLSEQSDGLCGELYSEEGWIEKYSAYGTYE